MRARNHFGDCLMLLALLRNTAYAVSGRYVILGSPRRRRVSCLANLCFPDHAVRDGYMLELSVSVELGTSVRAHLNGELGPELPAGSLEGLLGSLVRMKLGPTRCSTL